MTSYTATPASEIAAGDAVRPLAAVGPSVPKGGASDDYPATVARVEVVSATHVRIWAWPHGTRRSTTSPALYGRFANADNIDKADA